MQSLDLNEPLESLDIFIFNARNKYWLRELFISDVTQYIKKSISDSYFFSFESCCDSCVFMDKESFKVWFTVDKSVTPNNYSFDEIYLIRLKSHILLKYNNAYPKYFNDMDEATFLYPVINNLFGGQHRVSVGVFTKDVIFCDDVTNTLNTFILSKTLIYAC